jgi:hypothetical protein
MVVREPVAEMSPDNLFKIVFEPDDPIAFKGVERFTTSEGKDDAVVLDIPRLKFSRRSRRGGNGRLFCFGTFNTPIELDVVPDREVLETANRRPFPF